MDSGDLERERGITISAKNASFALGDVRVNIVDTPGHADFGGEVERIMGMVDGAILLVDAAEGPLPQTRFVLENAIRKGLDIILCINKVDRPEVRGTRLVQDCVDKTFDLFVELGASDEQCDFSIVYTCARDGWCTTDYDKIPELLDGQGEKNLNSLFELILAMPEPRIGSGDQPRMLVSNIAWSGYVGSMALCRILQGRISRGETLLRHGLDSNGQPVQQRFQAGHLYHYKGMEQQEVEALEAGDIGLITGCPDFAIGDTLAGEGEEALPRIEVEKPTMRMVFSINTSPFSGLEGKAIQSRELRERLLNEVRANPALAMEDTGSADQFYLMGRGELQFGIIIETMRREGFEFMVGRPRVLLKKDEEGKTLEPVEKLSLDLPEEWAGEVTRMYQQRRGTLLTYEVQSGNTENPRVRLVFEIPTRGILGTQSSYLTLTRGTGLMSSEILEYRPHYGDIPHRQNGSIISDRKGSTTAYALNMVQERGVLFVGEGVDLYEGMIIGEAAREHDLNVNACRPKKLTNIRTQGSDGLTILAGTRKLTLEGCIEWIDEDEWIEITPKTIRLRKKVLPCNQRSVRREDRIQDLEGHG